MTAGNNEITSHRNHLLSFILEQFMMPLNVDKDKAEVETFTDKKLNDYFKFNFSEYKRTGTSRVNL